jgi:hypothetical protein
MGLNGGVALSRAAQCDAKCTKPSFCDNCTFANGACDQNKIDITQLMKKLWTSLGPNDKFSIVVRNIKKSAINYKKEENKLCQELMSYSQEKSVEFSLLSDFFRYLQVINTKNLNDVNISIFQQHLTLDEKSISRISWYGLESIKFKRNVQGSYSWQVNCPYIICYESERLGLFLDEKMANNLPRKIFKACEYLLDKAEKNPTLYLKSLQNAETNKIPICNIFTYQGELQENGTLFLFEPEKTTDRRIFRMYSADRFLEISFASGVSNETIIKFLSKPVTIGYRHFRFFWFKREDSIRAVLFAENGPNINKILVSDVRERCIPSNDNCGLTLGKWVKRMKLNFSTTTVGCKLPTNSVSIVKDFEKCDIAEIDGAGLLSSEALQAIWNGYNKTTGIGENHQNQGVCPYSGFQGRLAG